MEGKLYAISEVAEYAGNATGSIATLSFDRASGKASVVNRVPTFGGGPAHDFFTHTQAATAKLLVANYGGGSLAVLPVGRDGVCP